MLPGSTAYEAKSYPYETEADYIKIPRIRRKDAGMLHLSFLRLAAGNDGLRPIPSGSPRWRKDLSPKAFITEGALNSIARNTQVNILATLSVDARLILKYEVVDWGKKEITVPPFN